MSVVVQTAHQARIGPIRDAEPGEPVAHPREEITRIRAEVIIENRSFEAHSLIVFLLGIENPQWIAFAPSPAGLGQLGDAARKIGAESVAVESPALRISQGIELKDGTPSNPKCIKDSAGEG